PNDQAINGPTAPLVTIGARVHIPSESTNFDALNLVTNNGEGSNVHSIRARVSTSSNLILRHNSSDRITVEGAFTPGSTHYIEMSMRMDSLAGHYALATVVSSPTDGTGNFTITDFRQYPAFWRANVAYSE